MWMQIASRMASRKLWKSDGSTPCDVGASGTNPWAENGRQNGVVKLMHVQRDDMRPSCKKKLKQFQLPQIGTTAGLVPSAVFFTKSVGSSFKHVEKTWSDHQIPPPRCPALQILKQLKTKHQVWHVMRVNFDTISPPQQSPESLHNCLFRFPPTIPSPAAGWICKPTSWHWSVDDLELVTVSFLFACNVCRISPVDKVGKW